MIAAVRNSRDNHVALKSQGWIVCAILVGGLCLPIAAFGEPTNGPVIALGFTNSPIGEETTLEVIQDGVLFVGQTVNGAGVSVQLGEADSGVFLFPLTGDLYPGDVLEGRAYGSLNGETNRFVSGVHGEHAGNSSVNVTADFSALGVTHLSVFAGSTLVTQVSNSTATIRVQGNGYGCRANPWWRLPDGSYGALIELEGPGNWYVDPQSEVAAFTSSSIFIRADDPTNTVQFISRVDVISTNFGSFCLTDAYVGMFHQRHHAFTGTILAPANGQLVVSLGSNAPAGVYMQLPGVPAFDVDVAPIELTATNAALMITGSDQSIAWITNDAGSVKMLAYIAAETSQVVVRSNGVTVGSIAGTNVVRLGFSGNPRVVGCGLIARTVTTQAGMVVRVDRPTTFTAEGGEALTGDELQLLASSTISCQGIESFAMSVDGAESFTITGDRVAPGSGQPPAPRLNIVRSNDSVILSWPDPARLFLLRASPSLADAFLSVPNQPTYADGNDTVTLSTADNQQQFFRLVCGTPND